MSETRLVILETSSRIGRVAVGTASGLRAERQLDQQRRHARDLAPAVQNLLHEQDWKPTDVSAIIVSLGPGSYTGLRVGLMSAISFAYATNCKVIGVETFAALALQAGPAERIEVVSDAQQGKVYHQGFRQPLPGGEPIALGELCVRSIEDWLAIVPAQAIVTGPAAHMYAARLRPNVALTPARAWHPTCESLLRLGLGRHERGDCDDLFKLEPLYARPSSAEEKWTALGR